MGARLPSAEAELLLDRVCVPEAAAAPSRHPPRNLDWLLLARLAERENLLGVLWPALASSRASIPDTVAQAMRRQARVSEFRMAALRGALERVVALLDDHDIPVMLMKGSALAVTHYASFAQRPMGDLDLLVRESQVQRAWDLLRAAGWEPERTGADEFYREHQHLCPLVAPGGANVVVELHRCLLYPHGPFQLPEAEVWNSASPVDLGGRTAWVPAPEHLMLHLCVHFAWSHEMRFGLGRTVRDVAVLAPVVDWDRLTALARATRAESSCYWTLRLAKVLGDVEVPPGVLASLAPRSPQWLRRALERIVTTEALDLQEAFVPSVWLGRWTWGLAIRPRASGHGSARPWNFRSEFGKYTQAPPPASFARRIGGQIAMLPDWAHFAGVAAGVGWPSSRRSGRP